MGVTHFKAQAYICLPCAHYYYLPWTFFLTCTSIMDVWVFLLNLMGRKCTKFLQGLQEWLCVCDCQLARRGIEKRETAGSERHCLKR